MRGGYDVTTAEGETDDADAAVGAEGRAGSDGPGPGGFAPTGGSLGSRIGVDASLHPRPITTSTAARVRTRTGPP